MDQQPNDCARDSVEWRMPGAERQFEREEIMADPRPATYDSRLTTYDHAIYNPSPPSHRTPLMRTLLSSAAAAALLLVAQPLTAQGSFATSNPVLQRIWTIGMDSSMTEPLARTLFDSLGPRLTGSPDQRRANDWLVKTYTSWGIQAKNEQYGTWRGWRRGYSHIDLISPRVRSLEGTMLAWSPGTGKKDLTAGTIILPKFKDSTEFVAWLPKAKGKFVLVAPGRQTCRPAADWSC